MHQQRVGSVFKQTFLSAVRNIHRFSFLSHQPSPPACRRLATSCRSLPSSSGKAEASCCAMIGVLIEETWFFSVFFCPQFLGHWLSTPNLALQREDLVPKEVRFLLCLPQVPPQPLHFSLVAPLRQVAGGRGTGGLWPRRWRCLRCLRCLRCCHGHWCHTLQPLAIGVGRGPGGPCRPRRWPCRVGTAVDAAHCAFRAGAAGGGTGPLYRSGQGSPKHGHGAALRSGILFEAFWSSPFRLPRLLRPENIWLEYDGLWCLTRSQFGVSVTVSAQSSWLPILPCCFHSCGDIEAMTWQAQSSSQARALLLFVETSKTLKTYGLV